MASNREVEIKFAVTSLPALVRKLKTSGFKLVTRRTHELNTLYDLPGQPLRARGSVLRLRQYGNKWTLTYKDKGRVGRHKTRREIETVVENGPAMDQILRSLGFQPSFRYEKFRSEWTDGKGHVVLDETPIGAFGEIEGPGKWIDAVAKKLGISRSQYVTSSYVELFQQWKRETGSKAANMLFSAVKPARTAKRQ
jgi:adenylate cyclase, class 2